MRGGAGRVVGCVHGGAAVCGGRPLRPFALRYASSRLLRPFALHCTRKRGVVKGEGAKQTGKGVVDAGADGPSGIAGIAAHGIAVPLAPSASLALPASPRARAARRLVKATSAHLPPSAPCPSPSSHSENPGENSLGLSHREDPRTGQDGVMTPGPGATQGGAAPYAPSLRTYPSRSTTPIPASPTTFLVRKTQRLRRGGLPLRQ